MKLIFCQQQYVRSRADLKQGNLANSLDEARKKGVDDFLRSDAYAQLIASMPGYAGADLLRTNALTLPSDFFESDENGAFKPFDDFNISVQGEWIPNWNTAYTYWSQGARHILQQDYHFQLSNGSTSVPNGPRTVLTSMAGVFNNKQYSFNLEALWVSLVWILAETESLYRIDVAKESADRARLISIYADSLNAAREIYVALLGNQNMPAEVGEKCRTLLGFVGRISTEFAVNQPALLEDGQKLHGLRLEPPFLQRISFSDVWQNFLKSYKLNGKRKSDLESTEEEINKRQKP